MANESSNGRRRALLRGITAAATTVVLAACAGPEAPASADPASVGTGESEPRPLLVLPLADTDWGTGPEATVKVALLHGDPASPGLFVQRMLMPEGTQTPPHWHAHDEIITVLSGSITIGQGDRPDPSAARQLVAGDTVIIPAHMHHFGGSEEGAVLTVQGIGPFEMSWLPQP